MTGWRRGRDLTLVPSSVSMSRRFDSEEPIFRVQLVDGLEAKVGRVRQTADGQQVSVVVSQPGDLKTKKI